MHPLLKVLGQALTNVWGQSKGKGWGSCYMIVEVFKDEGLDEEKNGKEHTVTI